MNLRGHKVLRVILLLSAFFTAGYPAQRPRAPKVRDEEAEAVRIVCAIKRAESAYEKLHGGDYATFQQLVAVKALDKRFVYEVPLIKGYVFRLGVMPKEVNGGSACFRLNADPYIAGRRGRTKRYFYVDCESDVIHVNTGGVASANDPPL